jgi:hypothetical protein
MDDMKPGDTVGPETIVLRNTGSITGATLDLSFSYVENDGSPNPVDMDADDTAARLEVTTLSYAGSSLLGSVDDNNSNSYKDVEDLKNADLSGQAGINASSIADFTIALKLRAETDNDYQADGIDITISFMLNQ